MGFLTWRFRYPIARTGLQNPDDNVLSRTTGLLRGVIKTLSLQLMMKRLPQFEFDIILFKPGSHAVRYRDCTRVYMMAYGAH